MQGIAGLPIGSAAVDGTPALDGVSAWDAITTGAPSNRKEMLLQLNPDVTKSPNATIYGQGAIRVGQWKLIYGFTAVWAKVKQPVTFQQKQAGMF